MESHLPRQSTLTQATIQSLTPLSTSVLHCRLLPLTPINYEPGHYAMVAISHTARAYSFATPPTHSIIEFLIDPRPQGVASRFWQKASAGQSLTLTGPYGHFLVDTHDTRPFLFIAGSTGLAPLRAHILWLISQKDTRPITLIVGHGTSADAFWDTELTELAAHHNFTYQGVIGPLNHTISALPNLADHTAYICGSANMVTSTAELLYQKDLPPRHVHYELFT